MINKVMIFVMDPIAQIKFAKDSTLAIAEAAQAQGWQLAYAELDDLYANNGQACANLRSLRVFHNESHWFELGDYVRTTFSGNHVILMRKDPPFNNTFLYASHILSMAEQAGSVVVNNPQALRDCNEKLFATHFPELCPPHLVSKNMAMLKEFHKVHQDVIFKPLDGMGGAGIFRCKVDDGNLSSIIEALTINGREYIMAQKYLPAISAGDKRILMVDGEPIDYALARIPAQGETRGNLAAGGRGVAQPLSTRDREIAMTVGPTLRQKGLLFVGLDVIGDYLTEINVTSPTCIREIDKAYNTNIGGTLIRAIEKKLKP